MTDEAEPSIVGESESYFFCKRGRKYKNSIRPNRVTGSGFWKATGIDKPVYSSTGGHACTGLKKTLVYYRGSAGKGTKTDWMMHEFRLPTNDMINTNTNASYPKSTAPPEAVSKIIVGMMTVRFGSGCYMFSLCFLRFNTLFAITGSMDYMSNIQAEHITQKIHSGLERTRS